MTAIEPTDAMIERAWLSLRDRHGENHNGRISLTRGELAEALQLSAPQEPEPEIERDIPADEVPQRLAQEPVADDDALIANLRRALDMATADEIFCGAVCDIEASDLRALLARLQAKAPETGEE